MVIEARDLNRPEGRLPPAEERDALRSRAGQLDGCNEEAPPFSSAERPDRAGGPPSSGRAVGWRLVLLLILPVVLAALGAYLVASQDPTPPVYAVRSEVVSDPRNLTWDSADRVLATRVVVAQSPTLLAPVANAFHLSVEEIGASFTAETVGNSAVIRLEYRHPDQALALNVTRALTDRYVATLREFEPPESAPARVLTAPFLVGASAASQPLRAAALGAAAGFAFSAAAIVLLSQTRRRSGT